MKALILLGCILATTAQLFAQTEANMCVSVTDVCCDGNWSSVDYTIPAEKQVTATHIHFEGNNGNRVQIQCYDVVGGVESFLWQRMSGENELCGCGEIVVTDIHPFGQNHHLRFKVKCIDCEDQNCFLGSTTVTFASNSTYPTCLPECGKN